MLNKRVATETETEETAVSEKRNENKTKKAQGAVRCSWRALPVFCCKFKFVKKTNLLKVDLLGNYATTSLNIFFNFRSSLLINTQT